ncbi:MAG: PorV/PorQ family protein [bacterium]
MKRISAIIFIIACFVGMDSVRGQEGRAGVESPFSIGMGARALGLGSASVAFPDDPSAFYWNPAGMVVVDQRGVGLSMTTLFEGTQYNFLGYVHPTMTAGTFGLGVARIGTGGIVQRRWERGIIIEDGEMGYWWGKLLLSYAFTPVKGLSFGVNLDVNRQVLGTYSTNGFGVDLGIHYGFPSGGGILRNLYFGCSVKNALQPRLRLGTSSETVPYTIRAGVAKALFLRQEADRWIFLADIEKGEYHDLGYHAGMEYGWNRTVFLRAGIDNGELTFGGGIRYRDFLLDYGTSRIADPTYFPRSHRFSLIFYFGKNVSERKRLEEEARQQLIQRQLDQRMEDERQRRIQEGLRAGREYIQKEDYFNARLEFSRVLREDPSNAEAQQLIRDTAVREQELQDRREAELLRQDREQEQQRRDNAFVEQRFNEGNEALTRGDYKKAIEKFQQALERDPESPHVNSYLRQARIELENEVNQLIARAKQLQRQGSFSEAYKMLNRAKDQTEGIAELQSRVLGEIQELDRVVDFMNYLQDGQQQYARGDYEAAARLYQRALDLFPNHSIAKERLRNALARSKGKKQEMTVEVRDKFFEGNNLFTKGQYEEAIQVWEEALKLDPNHIDILNAIERAKKKLELYKKKEKE